MNLLDNLTMFSTTSTDDDPLEALVRQGARRMLQAALEAEVSDYLQCHPHQRPAEDRDFRGYRNGSAKARTLTVGSGSITVKAPRVAKTPPTQEPIASQILKPYQRRSQTLTELFPKLFIEGLATRDFEPALRCLLGREAALSPSTISAAWPASRRTTASSSTGPRER
jgi:transposase-like protein